MILTSAQKNEVTELAITMFGAAPGGYKTFLEELYISNNASMSATAAALSTQPAFAALYTGNVAAAMLENLSVNSTTLTGSGFTMSDATAWISGQLGTSPSAAKIAEVYVTALGLIESTAGLSGVQAVMDNKIAIANAFTAGNGANVKDLDVLMAQMNDITADTEIGAYASLTVEQDNVFGSSADNVIKAFLSADTNTLQSGDFIDGGAGVDTLNVVLAETPFAIAPETVSIEKLYVQSQANGLASGTNEVEETTYGNEFGPEFDGANNTIDAQFMEGTKEFWSTNSRADLVIEDVRYNSHETKIGWQAADPGDVDYAVFFSPTYITKPTAEAAGAQLFLELLDLDSMALGNGPLDENPYVGVVIKIDGVDVSIVAPDPIQTTYQDLVDGLNASLVAQGYGTVTASLGVEFDKFNSDNGILYTGTTIVLTNTGSETLSGEGWTTGGAVLPADTNIHTSITNEIPELEPFLTQTDIVLDWVGRGSKAGDFLAGNMSTGDNSDSQGIEQFNVEVDRNSWLDSMQSTNDTLEVVNVVNIDDYNAAGNGSLQLDKLNDVRVFDAAAMVGDVTLTASLSGAVTDKYLDLTDTAADHTDDNSDPVDYATVVDREFSYDLGQGDDSLTLTVSADNLVDQGTVTREDFKLEVTGGAGDDMITFSVVDITPVPGAVATTSLAASTGTPWFANHEAYVDNNDLGFSKSNIKITAGTGDDTVNTTGGGSFDITTGAGNDTIYTDNAGLTLGDHAQWIVNATSFSLGLDPVDIVSEPLVDQLLYKATLTVTYSGATTTAQGVTGVAGAAVASTNGFESSVIIPTFNYLGSQAEVNQAIKDAINNDAVLSKLLIAQDGPADTLVIDSLVDGVFALDDLNFAITPASLAGLTLAEQAGLDSAWELMAGNSTIPAIVQADLNAAATNVLAEPGYGTPAISSVGIASTFENNNIIEAGTGDDVIVLSTDATSNEVLVFDGEFGNDTVFNFNDDSATTGFDILDFTTHLNNVLSASGSTTSQIDALTGVFSGASATVNANDFAIITGATFTATDTWAGLTGTNFLSAVQNNTQGYASIGDATLNSSQEGGTVGTSANSIVFVENVTNLGEYKVFEMVSSNVGSSDFTAATLLGSIDFGGSIDATTVVIA
ncbi:MAG: hypothetical protein L3J01_00350 [Thiomicrorhabdus sp.]|nr:hypothetical protein [Thiomicrorhabdus sp.]